MWEGKKKKSQLQMSDTAHRKHTAHTRLVVVFSKLVLPVHVWSKTLQPKPASQEEFGQACMNLGNTKVKKEDM